MRYFNINEITHDETTGAYGELVSPTDMTSDEKARIKSQMFSSIPKKNRRIQLLRAISGIAAAVIAFAGLAVTAEAMGWGFRLSNLLGATQEEMLYASESDLLTVGGNTCISDTDNGITMTIEQALADDSMCYLLIEATIPEDNIYLSSESSIIRNIETSDNITYLRVLSLTPRIINTDNPDSKLAFCILGKFDDKKEITNTISLSLTNLIYDSMNGSKFIEGNWNFSFDINRSDDALSLSPNRACTISGINNSKLKGTVTQLELTPLALSFDLVSDDPKLSDEEYLTNFHYILQEDTKNDIQIILNDWHMITIDDWDYAFDFGCSMPENNNARRYHYDICLGRIADITKVEKIVIYGAEIPVH